MHDLRRGVPVRGPVHFVLYGFEEFLRELIVAIVVDAGGIYIGDLLIEEPLAGADVADADFARQR